MSAISGSLDFIVDLTNRTQQNRKAAAMVKPRLIILIRHAQSEGNKNREIHQMIPDHRVKLTDEGHQQVRHLSLSI
jgi:hypothetical protein